MSKPNEDLPHWRSRLIAVVGWVLADGEECETERRYLRSLGVDLNEADTPPTH